MSSIADVIKKSIFGSVLSETVFYKDREIKAIVSIGTPVVRKNFFRGITVNDVVSDEASFTSVSYTHLIILVIIKILK